MEVLRRHSGHVECRQSIAELQHKIETGILGETNDIAWYPIAVTEREVVSICDPFSLIALHIKVVILFQTSTSSHSHRCLHHLCIVQETLDSAYYPIFFFFLN